MGTIRISYRHNLMKLVLFQALALQPGWYDVHQLCRLTGLRWCYAFKSCRVLFRWVKE